MYLLYTLAILALVYLAPAVAFWPSLLASSRTVVAVPIVSVAVVGLGKLALEAMDTYEPLGVRGLSLLLAGLAAFRFLLWIKSKPSLSWPRNHVYLLGFALLLGLHWAARLGTTAFDTNDEIYSWNLWAMQHALGEPIDLYYTQAPYPQLFAVLVSWKYQLLGDFELQLPLRATLALIPVALWGAIAVAAPKTDARTAWRAVGLMLLLAIAIGRWFGHGLADPLMAASLVIAIHCYLQFRAHPEQLSLLALSVLCASVAMFSKQPALLWGLAAFPALLLLDVLRRRIPPLSLLAGLGTLTLGLLWIFGAGSGFENNHGVINASQEGRRLVAQLVFAARELLLGQPLVLLLLIGAAVSVQRARTDRDVALLFLFPALLLWMIFGAYSLRLGIHVVACAALLISATGFAVLGAGRDGVPGRLWSALEPRQRQVGITLVALILLASGWQAVRNVERVGPDFSLYKAGHNALALYFGQDAQRVIQETYDQPDRLLWVPSNYLYGLYYHRTPMVRPSARAGENYSSADLLAALASDRPDFLFDAGDQVPFGPASGVLRRLVKNQCPELVTAIATPPNRYGYTLYRLEADDADLQRCAERAGVRLDR